MGLPEAGHGGASTPSVAAQAQEKVQQTAQQASQKAAERVRAETEARAQQLGTELQVVAQAINRSGHALHADGHGGAGNAVDTVTRQLEQLAGYLERTSGDRMLHDLESFGRRRPWGMIGLGVGVGLMASRFLKASSRTRFKSSQQARASSTEIPAVPYEEPRVPVAAGHDGSA